MRRTVLTILTLAFGAGLLSAQPAAGGNPVLAEGKQYYTGVKNNLIKMADAMTPENYDFKPTSDIRGFGELMAHIADAQMGTCSRLNGAPKTPDAGTKKTKDDIVAALKASFDECDKAWDGTTDANANEMIAGGRGPGRSRLGTLLFFTVIHSNEEYGYLAVYMRVKGVVPPSSAK